jgi:uncharacterized protein
MDTASGLCKGCWRTMDEIVAWGAMSDGTKRQVWAQIALRKTQGATAYCEVLPPRV